MKKIALITISLFLIAATSLKAENPIPSYNISVVGSACFQELSRVSPSTYNVSDEKRDMNVTNGGGSTYAPGASSMTVYMYRLDMKKSAGPFVVREGETITVPIDNQQWGVCVNANTPTTVSVWTDK